jgi:hypothetical protein
MNDVAIEIGVFALMVIQVSAFLVFGQSPVIETGKFLFIEPANIIIGTFPGAPLIAHLIAVFLGPGQVVLGIGQGFVSVVFKSIFVGHKFLKKVWE